MSISNIKKIPVWCLLIIPLSSVAEGIIDINPYVGTSINYDDNVFRLNSSDSDTSDTVKRVDLGVDVNLRLSRQLLTLSANINENRYNQFDFLDNTGKSYKLGWNWRIGNDLYGELSVSENESVAGFDEFRRPVRNLRTSSRQRLNINWNLHPDWTLQATREQAQLENGELEFSTLNRDDDIVEAGIRYRSTSATQLGLAYRIVESKFPNRTGFSEFLFGKVSEQEELIATAAWLPSPKTQISARISQINLTRKNLPQRDFSGIGHRWGVRHALTGKTNVNLSAYQEVHPIDDLESTYVKAKGFSMNPSWNVTSKITVQGGIGYEERDYLGSAGAIVEDDRNEEAISANLSLGYTPTSNALLQLQYQGAKRTSSTENLGYRYNAINFLMKYDF